MVLLELPQSKRPDWAIKVHSYDFQKKAIAPTQPPAPLLVVPQLELETGGPPLAEQIAIVQTLLEQADPDGTGLNVAAGDRERTLFLSVLSFATASAFPCAKRCALGRITGSPDEEAEQMWKQRIAPWLEGLLQKGSSKSAAGGYGSGVDDSEAYFVAGRMTACELVMAKPLMNADSAGLLEGFPKLQLLHTKLSKLISHAVAFGPTPPGIYNVVGEPTEVTLRPAAKPDE